MKIELKEGEDYNSSPIHELYINDKNYVRIHDLGECPEDANIGRDLIDGNDLIKYIKLGYEAGKNGELLEFVYSKLGDE